MGAKKQSAGEFPGLKGEDKKDSTGKISFVVILSPLGTRGGQAAIGTIKSIGHNSMKVFVDEPRECYVNRKHLKEDLNYLVGVNGVHYTDQKKRYILGEVYLTKYEKWQKVKLPEEMEKGAV